MVLIYKYRPGARKGWFIKCACASRRKVIQKYKELLEKYNNAKLHVQRYGKINASNAYVIWIRL